MTDMVRNRWRHEGNQDDMHRLSLPMIDRPPRRIIANECLGCGLGDVTCAAERDINARPCCHICRHE